MSSRNTDTSSAGAAQPFIRPESRATTSSWHNENEIGAPSSFSRFQKFSHGFRDVVQRNTGLLLFVASQAFYSMMDTAVKVLHGIDPPVTTLQLIIVRMVRRVCFVIGDFLF